MQPAFCESGHAQIHEPFTDFDFSELDATAEGQSQSEWEATSERLLSIIGELDGTNSAWKKAQFLRYFVANTPDGTLRQVIEWMGKPETQEAVATRIQVVKYFIRHKNKVRPKTQRELGWEVGVTKAAISKLVRIFSKTFGARIHQMRSEETCQKFSQQCKARHLLRKEKERQESVRKAMELNPSLIQKI